MVAALALPPALVPTAPAESPLLDRVEAFLTDLAADLAPAPPGPPGRGRPRILPALALWGGLTVCVLRGWHDQKALWRLVAGTGLWHFPPVPVSDEAVYRRLAAADPSPMEDFFATLTGVLTDRLDPYADRTLAPFAAEVFAVDQTTLDPVARRLPSLRGVPPGDGRLLPGKVAGVFDVRRQLWRTIAHLEDAHENEKAGCRDLVAGLPRRSLLLFDLGYFAFEWFDDRLDRRVPLDQPAAGQDQLRSPPRLPRGRRHPRRPGLVGQAPGRPGQVRRPRGAVPPG